LSEVPDDEAERVAATLYDLSDLVAMTKFPQGLTLKARNEWAATQLATIARGLAAAEQGAAAEDDEQMYNAAEEIRMRADALCRASGRGRPSASTSGS
jgi:hypothetical protein